MYKEVVRRNLIIIALSLSVFFVLSLVVVNTVSRRNLENELVYLSDILGARIVATDTEEELRGVVNEFTAQQKWFKVVIATSLGDIVIDSGEDTVADGVLRKLESFEMEKVGLPGNAGNIYVNGGRIYYIISLTDDIILRTSIAMTDNTNLILLGMFVLAAVLITVLTISVILTGRTSARITGAFANIAEHLKLTAQGRYEKIDEGHRYEEVSRAFRGINAVNKSIYSYIKQINAERDKLTFVLDSINEGIIIIGESGKVYSMNYYACGIFGTDCPIECSDYREIIKDETFCKMVEKEILTRAEIRFDYYHKKLDNIYLVTLNSFSHKLDVDDEDIVSIVLYDITSLRKEEQIKSDFIANSSHELKTPITSISGFAELLLSGLVTKPEDVKMYVSHIYSEAIEMKNTVEELLYLSKLDYSGELTDKTEVELGELVNGCFDIYRKIAEEKDVTLKKSGKKAVVSGSRPLLEHMLGNLVDNAIKYNRVGGKVTVETGTDSDGRNYIKVKDTGCGIQPQHVDKLFERFYRVENSRNRDTGGTGLGLTIVKRICTLHNAEIKVKSKYGQYTTFTVLFGKEDSNA